MLIGDDNHLSYRELNSAVSYNGSLKFGFDSDESVFKQGKAEDDRRNLSYEFVCRQVQHSGSHGVGGGCKGHTFDSAQACKDSSSITSCTR